MSTAGVLLAAGAGTRFADPQHKLLAVIESRAVVSHALASLVGASFDAVAVVTGAVNLAEPLAEAGSDIAVIPNERWRTGISSSVRCAARWASAEGHEAMVVGLADQPFVTSAAWQTVAAGAAPIAVGTYGGQRRNPVRLAREVWPLLPHDGDEGARTVIRRFPEIVVPVACEGSPDDIDTVEDLRRWS